MNVGDFLSLTDCRSGWVVRDLSSDETLTVWSTFENQTRVYRDGDDSLQLLPNDTVVKLIDSSNTIYHWGSADLKPGDIVRILHPSKHGGTIGIVAKGDYRYHVLRPHAGKAVYVDRDFLVKLDGTWELTRT